MFSICKSLHASECYVRYLHIYDLDKNINPLEQAVNIGQTLNPNIK